MSKDLDNELDDQLDIHDSDLSDEFNEYDDDIDSDADGSDYDADNEDEDDDDLDIPQQAGMPMFMKAGLAVAGIASLAGVGTIGYLTLAGDSGEQVAEFTDYTSQPAPNAISNMSDEINTHSTASTATETQQPVESTTTEEDPFGLGLPVASENATVDASVEVAKETAPALVEDTVAVSEDEIAEIKESIKAELEEKYAAKFNESISSLTEQIESQVANKLKGYNSSNSEYALSIAKLQIEVEKLAEQDTTAEGQEALKKLKAELSNKVTLERLSKEEKATLTAGRTRLEGFMVLTASLDGNMSIIRTPTDRVNVFFEGEVFNNAGRNVKVTDVKDHGYLVLVGSEYFIDEEYEDRKVVKTQKATPAKKPAKKPVKVAPKPKPAVTQKVDTTKVESRVYRAETINKRKVAVGWLKSGEYSKGYLVSNPSGEWSDVKLGDTIPTLGRVTGEDFDGNLIVGDFVILASE